MCTELVWNLTQNLSHLATQEFVYLRFTFAFFLTLMTDSRLVSEKSCRIRRSLQICCNNSSTDSLLSVACKSCSKLATFVMKDANYIFKKQTLYFQNLNEEKLWPMKVCVCVCDSCRQCHLENFYWPYYTNLSLILLLLLSSNY